MVSLVIEIESVSVTVLHQYYVTTNKLTDGNNIIILQLNCLRNLSAPWYSEERLIHPSNLVEEELPAEDFCKQKEALIDLTIKEITFYFHCIETGLAIVLFKRK